jgi:hypothetical protein
MSQTGKHTKRERSYEAKILAKLNKEQNAKHQITDQADKRNSRKS